MSLAETIIGKEKALLSLDVRGSTDKLRNLLSSEFREVGASGAYFGLAEVLESLPVEENWSCRTKAWEFRVLSDDVVQTFHLAFVVHCDGDTGVYSRRTSVWRIESGEWKMIYHQGTRVAPFDL